METNGGVVTSHGHIEFFSGSPLVQLFHVLFRNVWSFVGAMHIGLFFLFLGCVVVCCCSSVAILILYPLVRVWKVFFLVFGKSWILAVELLF